MKAKSSKRRKIDIFPKGINHDFGPKMDIFSTFLFSQYSSGQCPLRYSGTKKRLFSL